MGGGGGKKVKIVLSVRKNFDNFGWPNKKLSLTPHSKEQLNQSNDFVTSFDITYLLKYEYSYVSSLTNLTLLVYP